jgi:hypothetical protein
MTYQIRLPQSFTSTKQLITCSSTDDEVLGEVDTPNTVEAADERLSRGLVDSCNDWADEVRAKSLLIQRRGDEVRHGLWADVALLAQAVHVYFVAEEVRDGSNICGESRQTQKDVAILEDLGEVVGDCEGLHAEAEIASNGHAVLANHGYRGAAVYAYVRGDGVGEGASKPYLLRTVTTVGVSYVYTTS